jgi:hypothetical protein
MRGKIRGPLHGVPIAVKDLCWTPRADGGRHDDLSRLPSHCGRYGLAQALRGGRHHSG